MMMLDELNRKMAEITRRIKTCEADIARQKKKKEEMTNEEAELGRAEGQAKEVIDAAYRSMTAALESARRPGVGLIDRMEAAMKEGIYNASYSAYFDVIESGRRDARAQADKEAIKEKDGLKKKKQLEEELRRIRQQISTTGGDSV